MDCLPTVDPFVALLLKVGGRPRNATAQDQQAVSAANMVRSWVRNKQ